MSGATKDSIDFCQWPAFLFRQLRWPFSSHAAEPQAGRVCLWKRPLCSDTHTLCCWLNGISPCFSKFLSFMPPSQARLNCLPGDHQLVPARGGCHAGRGVREQETEAGPQPEMLMSKIICLHELGKSPLEWM